MLSCNAGGRLTSVDLNLNVHTAAAQRRCHFLHLDDLDAEQVSCITVASTLDVAAHSVFGRSLRNLFCGSTACASASTRQQSSPLMVDPSRHSPKIAAGAGGCGA